MTKLIRRLPSRRLYNNATTSLLLKPPRLTMPRHKNHDLQTNFVNGSLREFHNSFAHWEEKEKHPSGDSRINSLERAIQDDFAMIRETYCLRYLPLPC